MAESQSKILITISHKILLGCYDMISVYGGDQSGRDAEQVVSDVLKALILGMQNDSLIPSYESESEIHAQLDKYFPDLKSSALGQLEEMANSLEKSIQEGDSFDGVKKEIDTSIAQKVEIKKSEDEEPLPVLTFQELDEKDPLVIESKGNTIREQAIVEVYLMIAVELRGTNNARKMWELVLAKKEKEENIPAVESEAYSKTD